MAFLQSSGAISFSDIKGMFGGTGISIGNYIKGGAYVPNAPSSSNIPTSTANLSFSKYYNTAKEYVITVAATTTNYNWNTAFTTAFPAPTRATDYIARLVINAGVTIGATVSTTPALTIGTFPASVRLFIDNSGSIQGAGGAGATTAGGIGSNGGTAINADISQVTTIIVKSGGNVYGGGGGGGKGGAGGTGGKGADGIVNTKGAEYYRRTTAPRYYTIAATDTASGAWYVNEVLTYSRPSGWTVGNLKESVNIPADPYNNAYTQYYYSIYPYTTSITTGGTGGSGGPGGNGGRGAGYNQTVATGSGGTTGSAGSAGGTNAGTGGTGGAGGTGGNGGAVGNPGSSGTTGASGTAGNTNPINNVQKTIYSSTTPKYYVQFITYSTGTFLEYAYWENVDVTIHLQQTAIDDFAIHGGLNLYSEGILKSSVNSGPYTTKKYEIIGYGLPPSLGAAGSASASGGSAGNSVFKNGRTTVLVEVQGTVLPNIV